VHSKRTWNIRERKRFLVVTYTYIVEYWITKLTFIWKEALNKQLHKKREIKHFIISNTNIHPKKETREKKYIIICIKIRKADLSISVGELRRNLKNGKPQVRLADVSVSDDDAKYIAQDIALNTASTYVRIEDCKLSDEGASRIVEALTRNQTLETLLLGANRITDVGALTIAKMLPDCKGISKLSLASNQITNTGAKVSFKFILDYIHTGHQSIIYTWQKKKN
jgi:Ran GTPase-activating protein (RanGAP) involved in mRNA processing and transport